MDKLLEAKLYGQGLISVRTTEMVERYNLCLTQLGIETTSLAEFHIDGMGWSPEIAVEKNDNLYLSAGVANPMAIILTPDQFDKPLFYPLHSYDRDMIERFFELNHKAIADLTANTGVCVDIEQNLIHYTHPHDLLLLHTATLRTVPDDLMESALEQDRLIKRFLQDDLSWFNPKLRREIIASSCKDGDLRNRHLIVNEMKYNRFRSFHTQAFNGVFVIRPENERNTFLVYENKSILEDTVNPDKNNRSPRDFHLDDRKLVRQLFETRMVTIDLEWYNEHQDVYEEKRECLVADIICSHEPDCNYPELTSSQKKRILAKLKDKIPSVFDDLERLMIRVSSKTLTSDYRFSHELAKMLIRPHKALSSLDRETVWQLICRLQPLDAWRMYKSDKKLFYQTYLKWPESKKDWAIQLISKRNEEYMKSFE